MPATNQGEAAADEGAAAPVPAVQQVAYVPFDFRVSTFTGTQRSVNDPSIEEWAGDIRSLFKSWGTPADQQPQLLMKFLAGEAKREVQVMDPADREDSNNILQHLVKIYGEKTTTSSLLQRFHSRSQRGTETLREFSLALQEIMCKLRKQDPEAVPKADQLLRDRFICGLADIDVQRALRMEVS